MSHQWAFFVALAAGTALIAAAPRDRLPVAIYVASLSAMLGTSALYHRRTWSPVRRAVMRRLDHTMIFVLVAGTYTPVVTATLHGGSETALLIVAWCGALAGVVLTWVWPTAPRWVVAGAYIALGWVAVIAMPDIADQAGWGAVALLALGGVLYTMGAVVYARQRPDPRPAVFGFHEVFHVFVLAAAAAHFAAVTICVGRA